MKQEFFFNLLKDTANIQHLETIQLKDLLNEYPYFQPARAMYLKGLKNVKSFKYNNELKRTAAYTSNRTILFNYITSLDFLSKKETIHNQISNNTNSKNIDQEKQKNREELLIGTPLNFNKNDFFSFNEWLQIPLQKPILRVNKKTEKKSNEKKKIIEKFIKNNPKIEPIAKDKSIHVSIPKNENIDTLMTETLAKVYVEQKKYENAIQAFRILSLKYPEKSSFFANQIKRIEILQKN